jgi:hypothetical protein
MRANPVDFWFRLSHNSSLALDMSVRSGSWPATEYDTAVTSWYEAGCAGSRSEMPIEMLRLAPTDLMTDLIFARNGRKLTVPSKIGKFIYK